MTNEEFIKSISLEGEIWKDVVGYEGYYVVSNLGRVISLGRTIRFFNSNKYKEPHLMSDVSNENQYNSIVLKVDGSKKNARVHRLVAESFLENPNNYRCIDHIDGDKTNNNVCNLRWCTDLQNQTNPITRKKQRETLIQKNSKFSPRKVVRIDSCNNAVTYETASETKLYGFNQAMVTECCQGRRKRHRGYKWMYLSDYENLTNKSKNS